MCKFFCNQKLTQVSATFLLVTVLALLSGCSDSTSSSGTTTVTPTPTPTTTVAALQLSASPATVKSDNSSNSTITVTAVDAANVVVAGAKVSFSTNTGSLSGSLINGAVTTDSAGSATVTFSSGTASKANRVATITASAGTVLANIPVQIVGSTVTVTPTAATLPNNGTSPVTLTITTKDAGGNLVPNSAVILTTAGVGTVTFALPCTATVPCTTDTSGNLSVVATGGATTGVVTVTIAAAGATTTATLTVSPSTATFAIDQLTLNTTTVIAGNPKQIGMKIGDTLDVQVNAPAATSVVFQLQWACGMAGYLVMS